MTSSLFAQQVDTTGVQQDTTQLEPQSPLQQRPDAPIPEDAVQFESSDSLIIDFESGKNAFLFGSARVTHTSGELTAGEINMDIERSTVEATTLTPEDTLSQPVLTRETDEIRSNRILFNYQTKKGKFESAQVQVAEGHLIGSQVKNVSETEVFIEDGIYSTCPPDYLYYYIKAKKMKVVDQDELFFSNARLYILDIPYPLIFPFGYVPTDIDKQRSGLLTPTYASQDQAQRGLGLQNLGWFQYFNDYLTGQVDGDIYTSGTFFVNSLVQYRKRDNFDGSIGVGYSNERGLEKTDPDFGESVQKSLTLRHNQRFTPYANASANINLMTSDYLRRNSYDISDRAQTTTRSSVSYNYNHPENLYTFSTNAQLSQNFNNNTTSLSGPTATFRLKNFSPFTDDGLGAANEQNWYETLNISYNNSLRSRFNYRPIDADTAEISFLDALFDRDLYEEATADDDYIQVAFQQTAGLRLGQIIESQFINSSASINYNEYWYPSSIRRSFNPEENRVETEKMYGFYTARDFNTGINLSTTMYGISNQQIGSLQGFRHTFSPSVGLSYQPDFSSDFWGFYRNVQTDTLGNTQRYSIFADELISGPGRGEQRAINFSVRNVFETKIVNRDSTGEITERNLRFIDNLSLSTSYNFAADSLKLSNLNASISSGAIPGLNLNASANFSFYQVDSAGREIDRFFIEDSRKLAQLRSFSLGARTSFRGGSRGVEVFTPVYRRRYDPFNQSIFHPIDQRFGYEPVPPVGSPWSINLSFSYRWTYRFDDSPQRSAVLNAQNISFNLTPKWQFNTEIGYDFIEKELTPSQFSLTRNLVCWDLSFQINPFGEFQYYFFRLSVNSSQIQSLFQKLPVLKNLERSSSPTGRGRR
ncbi:MAG: putative LPS assembly protein LptD [Balneolaceae bacterium]